MAGFLIGCGADPADAFRPSPADSPTEMTPPSPTYASDLGDEPCTVLTASLVTESAGVPAFRLRQQAVAGVCRSTWEGGTAEVAQLTILESADEARKRFDRSYREMTPEGRARGGAGLREELDRRREKGDLSDRQQQHAEGVAGTIANLAAATTYEPISGIGDQAVYDGTIHTMETRSIGAVATAESRLHLRSGNFLATVAADLFDPEDLDARKAGPPPEVRTRNREVTLALGRAVLDALPRRAGGAL